MTRATEERLRLDLVFNPAGATLPPAQAELQQKYRAELRDLFGIVFDSLITIAFVKFQ